MDRGVHLSVVAAFFAVFYSLVSGPGSPGTDASPGDVGIAPSDMRPMGVRASDLGMAALLSLLAQIENDQYWSTFNELEQAFAVTPCRIPEDSIR